MQFLIRLLKSMKVQRIKTRYLYILSGFQGLAA